MARHLKQRELVWWELVQFDVETEGERVYSQSILSKRCIVVVHQHWMTKQPVPIATIGKRIVSMKHILTLTSCTTKVAEKGHWNHQDGSLSASWLLLVLSKKLALGVPFHSPSSCSGSIMLSAVGIWPSEKSHTSLLGSPDLRSSGMQTESLYSHTGIMNCALFVEVVTWAV